MNATAHPGELRWANVHASIVYGTHEGHGKERPVVLVRRVSTGWYVAGLTTLARYADGQPRLPVPDHEAVGLAGAGYLWGGKLVFVPANEIRNRIGCATPPLVRALVEVTSGLTEADVLALETGQALPPIPPRSGDIFFARIGRSPAPRAVVLVQRQAGHWVVAALTPHARTPDGQARVQLPNHQRLGFASSTPLFFFGNLALVIDSDLLNPVGCLDAGAAAAMRKALVTRPILNPRPSVVDYP